jgi:hypothetical protein
VLKGVRSNGKHLYSSVSDKLESWRFRTKQMACGCTKRPFCCAISCVPGDPTLIQRAAGSVGCARAITVWKALSHVQKATHIFCVFKLIVFALWYAYQWDVLLGTTYVKLTRTALLSGTATLNFPRRSTSTVSPLVTLLRSTGLPLSNS